MHVLEYTHMLKLETTSIFLNEQFWEDCCNVKGCSFGSSQPQIKCVSIVLVHIIV